MGVKKKEIRRLFQAIQHLIYRRSEREAEKNEGRNCQRNSTGQFLRTKRTQISVQQRKNCPYQDTFIKF